MNLGLNDQIVETLAKETNSDRFAWDCYRRLIQMYGEVVHGIKAIGHEADPFQFELSRLRKEFSVERDDQLSRTCKFERGITFNIHLFS